MCRVVYVHFACGHSDIVSTPCELAQDLPFYLKHACANYTGPVSMNPPSLCGRGKYYCGKAPVDGVFLNGVHMTLERRQGTLLQIDQKIALLKQRAREFTEAANRNNITLDARRKHPAYGVINNNYGFLMQQRSRIDYDRRKVTHVIKHAIEFFRERRELAAQQAALGFQPAFTLPPGAGSIPMEYAPAGSFNNTGFDMPMAAPGIPLAESGNPMAAAGIPMAAQPMAMTQQAIDVSQGTQMPEQTISHLTPSGGSNIDVIHVRRDTDPLTTPGQAATPNLTPQKALQPDVLLVPSDSGLKSAAILKRVIKQNSNTSGPRRRKPASPAKPSPAPAEDRNIVRRSDRVRTKKVTYAESQTSDFSRDSSPDKYEEESPVKSISEWSESPEPVSRRAKKQQRKPQRSVHGGNESNRSNNVTLASKIGDWKRRKGDTTDDTSGKSTSAQYASGKCERAAGQQEDAQSTGSACTSSKLWKAPRSQHSQVMMQGTAPSASTRQGTFSSGISAPQPPHSNSMQASLGRPFPDNTNEAAVFGPNLFNTYLQQSWPGGHHRSQPTQAWSVQQNAQNPSQQQTMMAGNNMQSATDFGQTQPPLNNQYIGGVDNFTTPSGPSNAALASAMQAMAPYFAATKAASTQQGAFPHGSDGYVGGYTPNPVSGLQTPSDSRADSVIYPEANCLSDIDVETYFDYDRLRRSFGSTTDLSPAKTPDVDAAVTEPKKRALPASSPTPSAKRMRLSLPGQANASSVYENQLPPYGGETDGTTATSLTAKVSTHQLPTTDDSCTFEETATFIPPMPTPAPIMAPTAIHFPQSQSPTVAENLESASELPSIVVDSVDGQDGMGEMGNVQNGVITGGFEDGNLGDDIDWNLMSDWFLSASE